MRRNLIATSLVLAVGMPTSTQAQDPPSGQQEKQQAIDAFLSGRFHWTLTGALVGPANRPEDPCQSIKDPTIVFYNGRWHLFCTIRSQKRSHQIEYLSFADWKDADKSPRQVLKMSDGYFCAPQVFYFTSHQQWYMIYQISNPGGKPGIQPAFSTSKDLADPTSWTKPTPLYESLPDNVKQWIDFWVICDEARAHLFFT